MTEIDLSQANLGRVANQNVDALIIANTLVWEASTADGPYFLNDALGVTPNAYTDGTPNIVIGHAFLFAVAGFITGVHWYDGAAGAGNWNFSVWEAQTSNGNTPDPGTSVLLEDKISGSLGTGYRDTSFDTPVPVVPNELYVVTRYNSAGHYVHTSPFVGPNGALNASDPVYMPGDNENISSVVSGWTGVRVSLFSIGSGDVVPQSPSSGAYYGVTPIFFKTL